MATNKRKVAAESIVSRFDSEGIIEDIKTSDCANPPLRKTGIVLRLLTEKRLDPKRTALVGDTKGDWEAADQNSLFFIYAAYGYGNLDLILINKFKVTKIDSFSQLLHITEK